MQGRKASPRLFVAVCSLVYFVSYFTRKDFAAVMAARFSLVLMLLIGFYAPMVHRQFH